MSRRKSETYGKALDLWQPPGHAGDPLICVSTTYTFDATFFETECIGRFLSMASHASESASVAYLIEREEKLAGARVHALVDRRHARDKESLRWDIVGILAPSGVQHAKLTLLVWKDHVRVIIGSGNLTEPGYRKNVEVFGTLELSRQEGGARSGVLAAIDFLREVETFAVGVQTGLTPRVRLQESLEQARAHVRSWRDTADPLAGIPVFNSPKKIAIARLGELWPTGAPPREAYVVSPFFDPPPNDGRAADGLKRLMAKRGEIHTAFYVKTEPLPDGRTRVYAPKRLVQRSRAGDEIDIVPLLPDQQGERREVHSKMLGLGNDGWRVLMIGSSNFTAAGLGSEGRGNLEANLVFRVKTSDRSFADLDRIWPDHSETPLDMSAAQLVWQPCFEDEEDGGPAPAPLPPAFEEALFTPGESPTLTLTLGDALPREWNIRLPAGQTVLSSGQTSAGVHALPWAPLPPPFVLEVQWHDAQARLHVANWPVNVSNPAALLPPELLRSLTLDELLDILASTRPLSSAVDDVLRKRKKGQDRDLSLDPLRRLDSQAFLLRRTKRVARALDRLKERLERPVLTQDAFEWRLRGVVGPVALADAFLKEARLPGEAKFCLAELALTLRRVDLSLPAQGGLSAAVVQSSIAQAIAAIEARAVELIVPEERSMLDAYVIAALREATAK